MSSIAKNMRGRQKVISTLAIPKYDHSFQSTPITWFSSEVIKDHTVVKKGFILQYCNPPHATLIKHHYPSCCEDCKVNHSWGSVLLCSQFPTMWIRDSYFILFIFLLKWISFPKLFLVKTEITNIWIHNVLFQWSAGFHFFTWTKNTKIEFFAQKRKKVKFRTVI